MLACSIVCCSLKGRLWTTQHDTDYKVTLKCFVFVMYSTSVLNKSNCFLRSISLQNFDAYKERESQCARESVFTPEGTLLDDPDLELRRNPPNVEVDNKTHPTETIITIDSANRPGTLVEVAQTESQRRNINKADAGGSMFDRVEFDGERSENPIGRRLVCRRCVMCRA